MTASDSTVRRLRTDDEIRTLTKHGGDFIWIKNIQTAGDTEFIESAFAYGDRYDLGIVSNAAGVIADIRGEYKHEYMTIELLDKIDRITHELQALITAESCQHWNPEEYRPLARYYTERHGEWNSAKAIIAEQGINKFHDLMRAVEQVKQIQQGSAPSLIDGVL